MTNEWIVFYFSTRRNVAEAWEASTKREAFELAKMLRARGYDPKVYGRAAYDAKRASDPTLPAPIDV